MVKGRVAGPFTSPGKVLTRRPMEDKKVFDAPRFKANLDACHDWPCAYMFKFIVAAPGLEELVQVVTAMLPSPELSTRETKSGKWVSLTVEAHLDSADLVVAVYERVAEMDTLLTL